MAKKSKRDRLQEIISTLRDSVSNIEEAISNLETAEDRESITDKEYDRTNAKQATDLASNQHGASMTLLAELQEEMDSWASGMEDSNLANSEKCENVRTASDTMDESVDELSSVEFPDTGACALTEDAIGELKEVLEMTHDTLDEVADNLESLEW